MHKLFSFACVSMENNLTATCEGIKSRTSTICMKNRHQFFYQKQTFSYHEISKYKEGRELLHPNSATT